ncbi:MAG: hypothetical protein GX308_01045 [Epulopiscium sp.]|nr:hypothetical protein [Candidatus Epulonipiscium sp.]
MNEENPVPPEASNPQENDEFDASKILEMVKLFSTLMSDSSKENNVESETEIRTKPIPVVYPSPSILFDETIHTPKMKAIKAAIPYMEYSNQKILGVFIKSLELKKVLDVYSNANSPLGAANLTSNPNWKTDMLNSIRPHCSEDRQCVLDMLVKIMDIGELINRVKTLKAPKESEAETQPSGSNNQKQILLQALTPMLDENQKQMLSMLTTLIE